MRAESPRAAVGAGRLARLAFAAAVVLSPFRAGLLLAARPAPPIYSGYTDLAVSWSGIAVLVTLGCWLLALAVERRRIGFGPPFLRWPAIAFLGIAWLTAPGSIDRVLSAFDAVTLVVLAGLALYVLNEIGSVVELAAPVALMVAVQAIVGVAQFAEQRSLGLGGLGELSLNPLVTGTSVVSTSVADRLLRAYGLTDHPNILGGLLAFALPILVLGLVRASQAGSVPGESGTLVGRLRFRAPVVRPVIVGLFVAACGLDAVALFFTFSRAAWLAALVGLLVAAVMVAIASGRRVGRQEAVRPKLRWPRVQPWLRAGVVGVAGIVAVGAIALFLLGYGRYVGARFGLDGVQPVTEEMSVGERPILVAAATSVFEAHPLTGTGFGTLPAALHAADPALTFDAQPAPVVLVDAAAELGVLGALAYLALLLAPWAAILWRRSAWSLELAMMSAALAAVSVVGLFDYYTWTFAAGRIWLWLVIGLWAGAFERAVRLADIRVVSSRVLAGPEPALAERSAVTAAYRAR